MSSREESSSTATNIIIVIGVIVIVFLVGLILYAIYVTGPEKEAEIDEFRNSLKQLECDELKDNIYNREYKHYHLSIAEYEYTWRCHNP